jgi:hypothetical protein
MPERRTWHLPFKLKLTLYLTHLVHFYVDDILNFALRSLCILCKTVLLKEESLKSAQLRIRPLVVKTVSTVYHILAVLKKTSGRALNRITHIFFFNLKRLRLCPSPPRIVKELRRKGDMSGAGPSMANGLPTRSYACCTTLYLKKLIVWHLITLFSGLQPQSMFIFARNTYIKT